MRIVIRAANKETSLRGKRLGASVFVSDGWEVEGPTLFASGPIPWKLVEAGFGFLSRWDAAVPLWRYGVLAQDVGSGADRARTEAICRDLRLLLYAPELLFVADTEGGRELVRVWREETDIADSGLRIADSSQAGICEGERLAFLRAVYEVKPRLCALPRGWLAAEALQVVDGGRRLDRALRQAQGAGQAKGARNRALVMVEIGPGRFVKCKPGDEETVRRRFEQMAMRREERRRCR